MLVYAALAQNGTEFDKVREIDKSFGISATWCADWTRSKLLEWAPLLGIPLPFDVLISRNLCVRYDLNDAIRFV